MTKPLIAATALALALAACGEASPVNPPTEPAQPIDTSYISSEAPGPAGAAILLPGTGPASFVGKWAAKASWCAAPGAGGERPIDITTTRFEGYENSCAIDAIDQTTNGYDATLICQAEGMTKRERVRLVVAGDTLNLTWLDRDPSAAATLVKCTTLRDTAIMAPGLPTATP